MEVVAGLIELKPDFNIARNKWKSYLQSNIEEALESIKNEGIEIESWFHLELDCKNYLLTYTRCEDFERSQNITAQSTLNIDQVHKTFKKCWGRGIKAEAIFELNNKHFND